MKGSKQYGAVSFTINYMKKQYNGPGANQVLQYILITISKNTWLGLELLLNA